MRWAFVPLVALALFWSSAQSATLHVYPDRCGDYPTIQDAVKAAAEGDTILLANGQYVGEGNYEIVVPGGRLCIFSESGDPRSCTINCMKQGRAFAFGDSGGVPFLSTPLGQGSTRARCETLIRAITITGGLSDVGGAVFCGDHSRPTIENCVFVGNRATETGGAIHFRHSTATLTNCLFFDNSAAEAGGGISFCC